MGLSDPDNCLQIAFHIKFQPVAMQILDPRDYIE